MDESNWNILHLAELVSDKLYQTIRYTISDPLFNAFNQWLDIF